MEFAKNGGYVVGIKSDKERFYFDITNNSEEIIQFAGSKYVKVDTKDIYKKIKARLIAGDKVLFFGVPCQIAGLYMFLQKKYENLFTVDLICHGTPSEKVLLNFIKLDCSFTTWHTLSHNLQLMHLFLSISAFNSLILSTNFIHCLGQILIQALQPQHKFF